MAEYCGGCCPWETGAFFWRLAEESSSRNTTSSQSALKQPRAISACRGNWGELFIRTELRRGKLSSTHAHYIPLFIASRNELHPRCALIRFRDKRYTHWKNRVSMVFKLKLFLYRSIFELDWIKVLSILVNWYYINLLKRYNNNNITSTNLNLDLI